MHNCTRRLFLTAIIPVLLLLRCCNRATAVLTCYEWQRATNHRQLAPCEPDVNDCMSWFDYHGNLLEQNCLSRRTKEDYATALALRDTDGLNWSDCVDSCMPVQLLPTPSHICCCSQHACNAPSFHPGHPHPATLPPSEHDHEPHYYYNEADAAVAHPPHRLLYVIVVSALVMCTFVL